MWPALGRKYYGDNEVDKCYRSRIEPAKLQRDISRPVVPVPAPVLKLCRGLSLWLDCIWITHSYLLQGCWAKSRAGRVATLKTCLTISRFINRICILIYKLSNIELCGPGFRILPIRVLDWCKAEVIIMIWVCTGNASKFCNLNACKSSTFRFICTCWGKRTQQSTQKDAATR